MPDWTPTNIRSDPRYARQADEVLPYRANKMVHQWAQGMAYREIAGLHGMTVDSTREVLTRHIKALWRARYKWKMAEMRCRALALELRCLRVGMECPEDQPIETLGPSERALAAFKRAGVSTVNQLRSVDAVSLQAGGHFPASAIVWAIFRMDSLGLSHRLRKEKKNESLYPKGAEYLKLVGVPPRRKVRPAES